MSSVFIDTNSGEYPYTPNDIRKRFPNVSLPKVPRDEIFASLGFSKVVPTDQPTDRFVEEGAPEQDAEGVWHQTWVSANLTEEEAAERLTGLKTFKRQEILEAYVQEVKVLADGYPLMEILTWDKQESEARAYVEDNTSPTPYIDSMAAERGIDRVELINRIIANSDEWKVISSSATGKKQRLIDALDAAQTPGEVNAIVW